MEKIKCACGRSMSKYFYNSTIRRKQCPNCELKNKLAGDDKAVKRGLQQKSRKKTARQRAMDRADMWFSRYIRLFYSAESNGELFCRCYTCNTPTHILKVQNGHWQRRGYKTTRFDPDDARPQCIQCNYYRSGMPEIFELNLRRELGDDRVERLKSLSQQLGEDNEIFYREQAKKYRILFNNLLKQRKIQNPWTKNKE